MEHTFVSALLLMFLMADPLGNIPIFISALKQVPAARRTKIILRECAIAALILSVFAFGGRSFLDALGLSQAALSIGGGLIVLLMAIRMVFPSKEGVFGESPSGEPFIVPLAVPAIAGPSTLATILVLVGSDPARMLEWLLVVLITCGISAVILVFADRLHCGISDAELHQYFDEDIHALADALGVDYAKACELLKENYDGYHFCYKSVGMYNPFSLLNTFAKKQIGSYWFETGTPTYLVELMKLHHYPVEEIEHIVTSGPVLDSIDAASTDPVPVIYQSGYLTIKDYNVEFENYTLGFPNREVEQGFLRFLLPHYASVSISKSPYEIQCFVGEVRKGDVDGFLNRLQTFFDDTPYELARDREVHYQNILYIVFKLMGFHTEVEYRTSRGRVDLVLKTSDYIYVMEFKLNGTAEEAMQQIEEKGYASAFASDSRKVIKVGINFSDETRSIERWIVA